LAKNKKHQATFLKTFFKERKQVGALAPSSKFLVNKMCGYIDFDKAKAIVELGPGTGVFSREIIARARKDAKIFIIELNDEFFDILRKNIHDPRVILVQDSADNLDKILQAHGVEKVDAILSSLPLAVIPEKIKNRIIIKSYNSLRKGGKFIQYQYSLNSKKLIERKFGKLKLGFVTVNIPPAFIYQAER
jgi:phosphatidylethanolamine/phosphatidyl-N-methylethanolamine N-methyltransferase